MKLGERRNAKWGGRLLGNRAALGLNGTVCLAADNYGPAKTPMVQFANEIHMILTRLNKPREAGLVGKIHKTLCNAPSRSAMEHFIQGTSPREGEEGHGL